MRLPTLRKRAEFERIRGGGRFSAATFVMEGKARTVKVVLPRDEGAGARFGFTISKKVGIAVVRNRIRRRLRAALVELSATCANPQFDYVVIARPPAFDRPYALLKADLETAFKRVHEGPKPDQRRATKRK